MSALAAAVGSRPELTCYSMLGLIWVAMMIVVNPIGDFPLNDDWALGLPVRDLMEKHILRYPRWFGGSYMAQLFIGVLFCLPFGFSFTALRMASATLGLVAVLATYALARQAGAERRIALVCALGLAVNPLVFQCANTFMTDVPFMAFMMVAVVFASRALRSDKASDGAVALAMMVVATLIRQTGLFIPMAVGLGMVMARKATVRRTIAVMVGAVAHRLNGYVFTVSYPCSSPKVIRYSSSATHQKLLPATTSVSNRNFVSYSCLPLNSNPPSIRLDDLTQHQKISPDPVLAYGGRRLRT